MRILTSEMERAGGAGLGTLLEAAVEGAGSGRVARRSYIVSLYSSRKDILERTLQISRSN